MSEAALHVGDAVEITRLAPEFARWLELLALIRTAFASMDGIIDPPSSAHRLTLESLRHKTSEETVLLATARGCIVGCLFAAEHPGHLYIGKLAVAPGHQGQGIGRSLIRSAEQLAIELGKPILELQIRVELTGNHATFAQMGFAETGRTAHPGFDHPTSITMRKTVAA